MTFRTEETAESETTTMVTMVTPPPPPSGNRRRRRYIRIDIRAEHAEERARKLAEDAAARKKLLGEIVCAMLAKSLLDANTRARFLNSPHDMVRAMPSYFDSMDTEAATKGLLILDRLGKPEVATARRIVALFIEEYAPRLRPGDSR